MSGANRVEVDLGGPSALDIINARQGSTWRLLLVFEPEAGEDDIDFATVTSARLVLKRSEYDPTERLAVDGDVTLMASAKTVSFTVASADTAVVHEATYVWEMELEASGGALAHWAPLGGTWQVVRRVMGAGS